MRTQMYIVRDLPHDRWLEAVVLEVEQIESKYGEALRFVFGITDKEYEQEEVSLVTSPRLNNKSKLFQLVTALGFDPKEGDELNTDDLVRLPICLRFAPPEPNSFPKIIDFKAFEELNP